jgi:hypothetical protein
MSCRRSVIIVDTNEYQLIGCMGWFCGGFFTENRRGGPLAQKKMNISYPQKKMNIS